METKETHRKKYSRSSLTIKNVNVWSHYYHNRFGWFRIFGSGLVWKDINVHGLNFSERNGYKKIFKLHNWSFRVLKNKNDF